MLVLKVQPDQAIYIGNHIIITFMEGGATWARIAIDAPKAISVERGEVREHTVKKWPDGEPLLVLASLTPSNN